MTEPEIIPPEEKPKRPAEFSDEIFDAICDRMTEGEGLRKICKDPDMPSRQTFLRWIEKDTDRQTKYQRARQALADWYEEDILTIAYDDSNDTIPATENQPAKCNHEWIARSRLKVDTLKWTMSKMHPKRYGDKPETPPQELGAVSYQFGWKRPGDEHTVADLMEAVNGRTRGLTERVIISPIHDDDGSIINCNDNDALRKRIKQLEQRLEMRDRPPEPDRPEPPKLLTFDRGPLPPEIDPEILGRVLRMVRDNVPNANERAPEIVLDEVMGVCERALQAKYWGGSDLTPVDTGAR